MRSLSRTDSASPHAVIVGAASGIGYQLARGCAERGYDLLISADSPEVEDAAQALRELGVHVDAVQADPATLQGVEQIHIANRGRAIDALLVHAGHRRSAEHMAVPQRQQVDSHITGTLYLLHKLGSDVRGHGRGHVLVTGSLAGFVPAFVDAFSLGLRSQLKDCGAAVTCVVPGAPENGFFVRTDRVDTQVVYVTYNDPTAVASAALEAMLQESQTATAQDAVRDIGRLQEGLHRMVRTERPGAFARI